MSFDFHTNHKLLLISIATGFLTLSIIIAVLPARFVQDNNPPLPNAEHRSPEIIQGQKVFISEGCVGCHTQQVRNIAIDKTWGERPSVPGDFAKNGRIDFWRSTPSVLGTERTGPDLTNIGARQGSDWQFIHLYNPRMVVPESIMPAYPWLFLHKEKAGPGDKVINVPADFQRKKGVIVPTQRAEYLVAYLNSLKQVEIPASSAPEFIEYEWMKKEPNSDATLLPVGNADEPKEEVILDLQGPRLYRMHCQACHQANGEGLPKAFPPLKGSSIVLSDSPVEMIRIILNGIDRDNEFGAMPGLGVRLSDEQIAAIVNYERNNWGNKAPKASIEEVSKVRKETPEL